MECFILENMQGLGDCYNLLEERKLSFMMFLNSQVFRWYNLLSFWSCIYVCLGLLRA